MLGVLSTGCSSKSSSTNDGDSITVFAAASLREVFGELATRYEEAHPGAEITLNFAASSELVTQIDNGAPADVFASADEQTMNRLADAAPGARVFATNRLQIVVEAGNPNGVRTLADLARPDLLYIAAAPEVPVGRYAAQVLAAAGVDVTPRSLEANVKGIVSKVLLGEADAGIVYITDVRAAGDRVSGVDIPDTLNVEARYPITVLRDVSNPAGAQAFVDFVLSPTGQQVLREFGFGVP